MLALSYVVCHMYVITFFGLSFVTIDIRAALLIMILSDHTSFPWVRIHSANRGLNSITGASNVQWFHLLSFFVDCWVTVNAAFIWYSSVPEIIVRKCPANWSTGVAKIKDGSFCSNISELAYMKQSQQEVTCCPALNSERSPSLQWSLKTSVISTLGLSFSKHWYSVWLMDL